jgi:acyl-CoA hydrolase
MNKFLNQTTIKMKKAVFVLFTMMAFSANAQKMNYKVGLVTGLPANVTETTVGAGSTMLEASTKISKKLVATANTGYMRINHTDNTISQIPVLVGVRYGINTQWYFGAAAGITVPTKKAYGSTQFGYSPYIGYTNKKISVDGRYYLSNIQTPISTMCLVFSYNL